MFVCLLLILHFVRGIILRHAAMLYYVMMNVTIQKYNIYPICRESGDGWFVSEWSGHLNVSCIGAWPRPALTKLTKLRPILCKVLLVSDVYPHFIFIPLTRGHYTIQYITIQYNTLSPLSIKIGRVLLPRQMYIFFNIF